MEPTQFNSLVNLLNKIQGYLFNLADGTINAVLGVTFNTGPSDATTLRTVTASDSPELAYLTSIESQLNSSNTKLDTLTSIESKIDSTNTSLATLVDIDNNIDTVNTKLDLLTSIDSKINISNTYLDAGVTKPSSNADAGVTTVTLISAATANATVVKNSNGNVYGIDAMNNSSTIHYLKLYNKPTAPSSADTPLAVYMIPANTSGAGFVRDFTYPMEFSSGISYRIVTGIANNDNTSATANAITLNIQYE